MSRWCTHVIALVSAGCGRYGFVPAGTGGDGGIGADALDGAGASDSLAVCASAGLVGYWRFDEGPGATIASDEVGGLDGALVNFSVQSAWLPGGGMVAGALALDGIDDYIDLGDPPALELTGALTVTAWARPAANHDGAILGKEAGVSSRGYMLRLATGATDSFGQFAVYSDCTLASQVDANGGDVPTGQWHHLAGVFRPSVAVEIYVDGALAATETALVPVVQCDPAVPVHVGRRPNGTFPFAGELDELRVYSRALSAVEIAALYTDCR